ncbi:MAG: hypothetical protein AAF085_15760 [Planctomycetota bacterium]
MQNSTQLRGIHQGMVTYSQSNQAYFPGLNALGENERIRVEERFQILMEEDYITPDYAISPSETEMITEWDGWADADSEPVTKSNYSYAMLQVPEQGRRRAEWSQSLNSQAIVLSDRNTGNNVKPSSIHSETPGSWTGSVLWNDNHVGFEQSDAVETCFGEKDEAQSNLIKTDRLFEATGNDDAWLIYTGNGKE